MIRVDSNPSDLKSWGPTNAVKICAMSVQQPPVQSDPYLTPPPPPPLLTNAKLHYCHVRRDSVLSLCILLILLWFPVGKTR